MHPVTLGKLLFLRPLIDELEIDDSNISANSIGEFLRLVREKKSTCLKIIVCHTCENKSEVFDEEGVAERMLYFEGNLTDDEVATLLMMVLMNETTSLISRELGIDAEQQRLQDFLAFKKRQHDNSILFGGKTIFGCLLDAACERYGWTKDYVVWGIDYTSLRLMLRDKVVESYLTDDERKKFPARLLDKGETIKVSKENMEQILSMDWT